MRALIMKKNGEFSSVNGYVAWDGLRLMGLECGFFEYEQLDGLSLDKETLVYGSVGAVHKALDKLGIPRPNLHPTPPELDPFYGRWIRESTLKEVRQASEPVFVKPLRDHKVFTGYVRKNELDDVNRSAHLDDDFAVVTAEVVSMISEWRCFIHDAKCVAARPYAGLPTSPPPSIEVVHQCIELLAARAPIAYSIDLARLNDGRTVVVEINDAYALGCYGMPSIPYAQMIEARWRQMTGAVT